LMVAANLRHEAAGAARARAAGFARHFDLARAAEVEAALDLARRARAECERLAADVAALKAAHADKVETKAEN